MSNIKKSIIINNKVDLKKLDVYDRLYIGNDFCEKNINEKNIVDFINLYKDKKYITLLLPFLSDNSFFKIEYILKNISISKKFEIVFNDWGTFFYLRKYYPKIKLVLGRLLTKQRKDPRIDIILKNQQDSFKIFKLDNVSKIVYTKKVPQSLGNLYSSNILETQEFVDFCIANNIDRIELDNLVWNMVSNIKSKIKVSLYYPYILLSLTRYCGALNLKFDKVCNKDCIKKIKKLSQNYYIKGNSLYYKNDNLPKIDVLKSNNIDRIIYQYL